VFCPDLLLPKLANRTINIGSSEMDVSNIGALSKRHCVSLDFVKLLMDRIKIRVLPVKIQNLVQELPRLLSLCSSLFSLQVSSKAGKKACPEA